MKNNLDDNDEKNNGKCVNNKFNSILFFVT